MQVLQIVLDFMLFLSTSLILSICILCFILNLRVSDRYLKGFLSILVPLLLQSGLVIVNTYITRLGIITPDSKDAYAAFALLGTFCSIICSAAILLFVSRYLVELIPISKHRKRAGYRIISILTVLYFIICLFSVFFINSGDWMSAFNLVLNELFISGSVILSIHGVIALFYIKNAGDREQENLMRAISMTFIPLIPFFILDLLFLKDMAFKLTYISYAIFCVNIYLFVSRNYIRKYEPEPEGLSLAASKTLLQSEFSKREQEILELLIKGHTNKEIGEELYISINTVKTHIKNIYSKLNVSNRIQLISKVTG